MIPAWQVGWARSSNRALQARWLDDLGLAPVLGLASCAKLLEDSGRGLLHTTSAVRYPVFARKRDGSLTNYSGSSPGLTAHPWLRAMIE